jgi:hypothetical protein
MANAQSVTNTDVERTQAGLGETAAVEPARPARTPEEKPHIPNYLGKGILALFLFPPTALVAVWFAAKVNDFIEVGDYDRARAASGRVRKLFKISLIIAPIWIIAAIVIPIILAKLRAG